MEWVNSLKIEVPKYSTQKLFQFAVENYNDLWASRGNFEKLVYRNLSNFP